MVIIHKAKDIVAYRAKFSSQWKNSGFVPTMGALHEGHLSLIKSAKKQSDLVVVSIFVNPTQFNDPADFIKYPKTIDSDIQMLETAGCDILFLPDLEEIYPRGLDNLKKYDLGDLENILEGFYRPGHFQGVCQVVHRLMEIVYPEKIFLGQKDFQQTMVIQKLIQSENLDINQVTCPTLREKSGLAMSSRNRRLSSKEQEAATIIFRQMQFIKENLGNIPLRTLEEMASMALLDHGFHKIDYVSIAHQSTLVPVEIWEPGLDAVVLVAAFIGEIRLIDNMLLSLPEGT